MATFTSATWSTPQAVTVTGVDDAVVDGDVAFTVAVTDVRSADPAWDDLDSSAIFEVSVTNTDDDTSATPGLFVSRTSGLQTTEAGGTDTVAMALTAAPGADVTIFLRSDDASEAVGLEAGPTHQSTVDVRALQEFCGVGGLDTAAVLDAHLVSDPRCVAIPQ